MDQVRFQEYIRGRYEDQIQWYSKNSTKNKSYYMGFQWGVIIFSAIIPVMVVSIPDDDKWFTAFISVILAIGTAALKTFKFQEHWINYRTISETLKKEKFFYDAGLDDYGNVQDREALFVDRVEALISRENTLWVTTHIPMEAESDKPASH